MNNIIILAKVAFKSNFRRNSSKQKKSAVPTALATALLVFLGLYLLAAVSTAFVGLAISLQAEGKDVFSIEIIAYILATAIMLFFTIFQSHAQLFKAKDLNMLMAMPVTPFQILISKLTSLYLSNLFFGAIIFVPTCVVHFIFGGFTPYNLLIVLLSILTAPCIAMTLSFILAFLVSLLPENSILIKLLSVVGFLGIFAGYMMLVGQFGDFYESFGKNIEVIIQNILTYYFPANLLYTAYKGNVLSLLLLVVFSIALVSLAGLMLSKIYFGLLNKKRTSHKKTNSLLLKNQHQTSVVKAVFKKELTKYFSSVLYILNTIMGIFLLLAASVATIFGDSIIEGFSEMKASNPEFIIVIATIASVALISMTCTTSTSISLEGKNLWILRVSSINCFDIYKGKILLNLLLIIPLWLISSIILFFTLNLNFFTWLLMLLIGIAVGFMVSTLGILINLIFPKLDAIDDTQIIKQSLSATLGIFAGMIVSIPAYIIIFPCLFAKISSLYILLGLLVYYLIITSVSLLLLKKFGENLFYKLKA